MSEKGAGPSGLAGAATGAALSSVPVRSNWIVRPATRSGVRLRLFCFPYAGGTAATYRPWDAALAPHVEVCPIQLPGRASRFREPAFKSAAALIPAAADALAGFDDLPFAFYGHSMGALVAFQVARELRRRGERGPCFVVASGHKAPHRPDPDPPLGHLSDAELVAELRDRYDGIPPEVLAEAELMQLLLPVLRADILVMESCPYTDEPPLDCPVACYVGEEERHVDGGDHEAWREQTRGGFVLRRFPGRHFFIDSARPAVLEALKADLGPWAGSFQ